MQTVTVTIEVRESYNTSTQTIAKKVECKDFEATSRLVGKLLQHLPQGASGTYGT